MLFLLSSTFLRRLRTRLRELLRLNLGPSLLPLRLLNSRLRLRSRPLNLLGWSLLLMLPNLGPLLILLLPLLP
jgi:hypothetical protein